MTKQTKKSKDSTFLSRTKGYRYYGRILADKATKLSWISQQNKNGWSLGLLIEGHKVWLRSIRFSSEAQVTRALGSKVEFIAQAK